MTAAWTTLLVALLGTALVLGGYPMLLLLLDRLGPRSAAAPDPAPRPLSVSVLVAVRNGRDLIGEKIRSVLAQDHPGPLEVVVASDGSDDGTEEVVAAVRDPRVRLVRLGKHVGKARALNAGAGRCSGEVVVLSDADAMLAPDAVSRLVARFVDPAVGGVCGLRVLREPGVPLAEAQAGYVRLDSLVKLAESRRGSITSNDGKLYAVRRDLLRPVEEGVTDDLWVALNVVDQGHRFVFEPAARAFVRTPSRSPRHELSRRRRIVSRSLRGLYLMRGVLDPVRHGIFAFGLLVNKVARRALPLFLACALVSSALLAPASGLAALLLVGQLAFYGAALVHALLGPQRLPRPARRLAGMAHYFVIGNVGTALGVVDFLAARRVTRWDPLKTG